MVEQHLVLRGPRRALGELAMSSIQFFATADDLRMLFEHVEATQQLTYTRAGHLHGREAESYTSGRDLPNLGAASSDAAITCDAYLVTPRASTVVLRQIDARIGRILTVDQLLNPDTVIINVGGLYRPGVLIASTVGTAHDTPVSRVLFASWRRPIRRLWTKRNAAFVGPRALGILQAGGRLTWTVAAPREYDLA